MIKATYFGEVLYFETLQETINFYYSYYDTVIDYYNIVIEDLLDFQEVLKEEANSMAWLIILLGNKKEEGMVKETEKRNILVM